MQHIPSTSRIYRIRRSIGARIPAELLVDNDYTLINIKWSRTPDQPHIYQFVNRQTAAVAHVPFSTSEIADTILRAFTAD